MRILIDCRPLQKPDAAHERTRMVLAAAKQIADKQGIEWVFLISKRRPALIGVGGGGEVAGSAEGGVGALPPGEIAAVFWDHRWTVSRTRRRYRCDKVLSTAGLVLPPAVDTKLAPLSMEEREAAKRVFAAGKEYFFADVSGKTAETVVELLKAFSKFKKRQKSNLQLVLSGAGIGEKLATYKYKEDVHCLSGEHAMAAAYAVIIEGAEPGLDMLEAWTMRVPVIRMAYGDAGLADRLMLLYKDERMREQEIDYGLTRSKEYGWGRTEAAIMGVLGE